MDDDPLPILRIAILAALLALILAGVLAGQADAYRGTPLYWYGDRELGKETAFASWWEPPSIPLVVRNDWHGVALRGYAPGTKVRLTVIGLPAWAGSWPALSGLIGNTVIAYVADRPGGEYGDAWPATFSTLTNGRLWIGKLYVEIEEIK